MNQRIRGTLLAAAVVGGGVLGATGLSSVAFAREGDRGQDQPAVAVQTDDGNQAPDEGNDQGGDQAPDQGGEREGRGRHHGCHLEAAADAIGISEDELRSELESGKTIADVAEENDVSTEDVVDAMVADVREHLDEKVADGELTQEEADQRLTDAQDRIEERVTSPFEPRERGDRPERPDEADQSDGSGQQTGSEDAS